MTEIYISVGIGTAAALLATLLLSLRVTLRGRKPALILAQRWIATSPPASALVIFVVSTISVVSFFGWSDERESLPNVGDLHSVRTVAQDGEDTPNTGDALAELRTYAGKLDENRQSTAPVTDTRSVALPDVDTMIAQLEARLKKQPDDVKGWKMLGWSYFNMDRPEDATTAYETALKLKPGDVEIRKELEQAKSARSPNSR